MLVVKESEDSVTFDVRVVPRASRSELRGVIDGALKVSLSAPPVDGAANAALIEFLAELLSVQRRAVEIQHGLQSKRKVVRVSGLDAKTLRVRLNL